MQRSVKHLGMTTIGSPETMYLLVFVCVIKSKWAAQYLLPTLGAPKVITFTLEKTAATLMSIYEITERPPPKLIPVIIKKSSFV